MRRAAPHERAEAVGDDVVRWSARQPDGEYDEPYDANILVQRPGCAAGVWAGHRDHHYTDGMLSTDVPEKRKTALRASLGRCLLFFLAQAPIVSLEKRLRAVLGVPAVFQSSPALCTAVWTIALVPLAPLFLHPLKTSDIFGALFELVPRAAFA